MLTGVRSRSWSKHTRRGKGNQIWALLFEFFAPIPRRVSNAGNSRETAAAAAVAAAAVAVAASAAAEL
jgi:hypothetical protein